MSKTKITFAMQAERFLEQGATRKRNPLRPASLRTYRAQIGTHLLPLIGKMNLELVGNKIVNELVSELTHEGLSARTIALNVTIIKKIRKSAVSENGDQLFPYEWNADVIDAPVADGSKQPTVNAQMVQDAISKADTSGKALYALLAGTGLRIAEALALRQFPDDGISTVWLPDASKIIVRQQMTRDGLAPTKTKAGPREVDLAPELNKFLIKLYQDRIFTGFGTESLLFNDCEGCYRVALQNDGIEGGFHCFRRFRVTHIRMNGVPDPLVKYWIGHAASNTTEHYTQVEEGIEARKTHAARVGLGFQLPEVV
jgi:integrase